MIETYVRSKVQPLFDLLGKLLISLRLTSNKVTLLAFLTGVGCAVSIVFNNIVAALVLLLFSGLFDILDGTVARISNKMKKSGSYLDLIADRMVECAIIIGFTLLHPQYFMAYILFLCAVIFHFSTFLATDALFKNTGQKNIHHDKGLVERTEIFIIFALLMIFQKHIFEILMLFNLAIFASGYSRFLRIFEGAKRKNKTSKPKKA